MMHQFEPDLTDPERPTEFCTFPMNGDICGSLRQAIIHYPQQMTREQAIADAQAAVKAGGEIVSHTPIVVEGSGPHGGHYGGASNPYEAIKVIEAWDLGFCLGNAVKYISRAGRKDSEIKDLEKAAWYLARHIEQVRKRTE